MIFKENEPLAPYTTFKIGGPAKVFCRVGSVDELKEAIQFAKNKNLSILVLGGGSNMLVSDAGFNGLVIKTEFSGIETQKDGQNIFLKVASGENWDKVVELACKNNWWGMENLSHIPGNSGAIAVQNVGAYGQEASQVVEEVEVFDTQNGAIKKIQHQDCGFAYRTSIFNSRNKGRYVILSTTFKLSLNPQPNLSYRDLQNKFAGRQPAILEIRQAVTAIRDTKFPFPVKAKNGNAGSFFKNPIITAKEYQKLEHLLVNNFGNEILEQLRKKVFADGNNYKVPAAFLLDICGMKDVAQGGAKINHNQPLVIINATGAATANDVYALMRKVQAEVKLKTGLELQQEPVLIGF